MSIKNRKFTDEQFSEAIKTSISKAGVLRSLGLIPAGANYKMFDILVKQLCLDTGHLLGKGYLRGKKHAWSKKMKLSKILTQNSTYNSNRLRKRLIREGKLENKCSRCKIIEWQGCTLSLHLDHINGINTDNRLKNLRLLCPNCHSLTPTYCGKNKGKIASTK